MFKRVANQLRLVPSKFYWFLHLNDLPEIDILDVGCGNNSPSITKRWFPKCRYFGVDKEVYNLTSEDLKLMDRFFKINLDNYEELKQQIEKNEFNLIIMSHVIEHLQSPEQVVATLAKKLKENGILYVEFPSPQSVHFPRMKTLRGNHGTVNFYDDLTHLRVFTHAEIAQMLSACGLKVVRSGIFRNFVKIAVSPLGVLLRALGFYKNRPIVPIGLWDILGFRAYVVATNQKMG